MILEFECFHFYRRFTSSKAGWKFCLLSLSGLTLEKLKGCWTIQPVHCLTCANETCTLWRVSHTCCNSGEVRTRVFDKVRPSLSFLFFFAPPHKLQPHATARSKACPMWARKEKILKEEDSYTQVKTTQAKQTWRLQNILNSGGLIFSLTFFICWSFVCYPK